MSTKTLTELKTELADINQLIELHEKRKGEVLEQIEDGKVKDKKINPLIHKLIENKVLLYFIDPKVTIEKQNILENINVSLPYDNKNYLELLRQKRLLELENETLSELIKEQ